MDVTRVNQLERTPYRLTELWKRQEGDEDSVYVMDAMEGHIYQLNVTAGYLWTLMDNSRTLGEIIAACLEAFDTDDADRARASLLECVDDLCQKGLIAFQDD